MKHVELLVIGAGPAGLSAAYRASEAGCQVLVVERDHAIGGQLVKQTHKFFGSEKQYASTRGIHIVEKLKARATEQPGSVEIWTKANVLGLYEDGVVTLDVHGEISKVKPKAIVVATGAYEKSLPFPGNDLPGVYGAGAVQTLMNAYGILPGNRVVMVGAGNIGLIVSYQLMQAGVEVAAVIDAADRIGGYLVHASKIRRAGVPIYVKHTVKAALGVESVEGVDIVQLDDAWQEVPGTTRRIVCDLICVAVGLTPLADVLYQAGAKSIYVAPLGGYVPLRDQHMMTTLDNVFIAGDVAGIEEASSAMVEGELAGLSAAKRLGYTTPESETIREQCLAELRGLRAGPAGGKIRTGLALAGVYQ